jgi:hypothetical protein
MASMPPKGPTNFTRMRTIVTAALQRQYLQTELILLICLVICEHRNRLMEFVQELKQLLGYFFA